MEEQLREYRALRRRQEIIEKAKKKQEFSSTTKGFFFNFLVPKAFTGMQKKEDEVLLLEDEEETAVDTTPVQDPIKLIPEASEVEPEEPEREEPWKYIIIKWSLYFVIWLTVYIMFLKVGFGAVFFVISLLVGICLNTRTKRRKQGEVSAYSVFNEDCTSIDGTLKAEQFERELRFGPGAVRPF